MTRIQFKVTSSKFVKLIVFDLLGREVAVLVNDKLQAGTYEISFDAGNLSSGVYFYTLKAGDYTDTKPMVLIK
jgi:5-hydroxyisourate hydrolase-like protein (transthyretin family)